MTHRTQSPTATRRSSSPRRRNEHGEDPFANYRSFDQFRGNREPLGLETDSSKLGQYRNQEATLRNVSSPPRNVSSPPRHFSSPPRNISSKNSSTCRPVSLSGAEPQLYSPRKTSNSSSGSGSGLYSDSGFGSYTGSGVHSGSSSAAHSGSSSGAYSAQKYSSLESTQSYGRSVTETQSYQESTRKYQGNEQKRSTSPVKVSLGALKLATIQPWDEDKDGERRSSLRA